MNNFEHPINISETSTIISDDFEVNKEINDTKLVISRLRHPAIKKQVIDIIFKQRSEEQATIQNDKWEPYSFDGRGSNESSDFMIGEKSGKILSTEFLQEELARPVLTKDDIEEWYEDTVQDIETKTDIDFKNEMPSSGVMHLGWIQPHNNQKPSTRQWSAIEAHEKGHRVREYHDMDEVFQKGFDISKATFTQEDYETEQRNAPDENVNIPLEDKKHIFMEYLFSASEIAERMAQLKNYFGFSGNETFTKAHLDYARKHYLEDTDLQNGMRQFFEAITPETEGEFLRIINNCGI